MPVFALTRAYAGPVSVSRSSGAAISGTRALGAVLGQWAPLPDSALADRIDWEGRKVARQFALYAMLRAEQSAFVRAQLRPSLSEVARILALAQQAYRDLSGLLAGRSDAILDAPVQGQWSVRELLRHTIAAELRYAAQISYSARRRDDEPVAIPDPLLPCDRLSPPDPEFGTSRTAGVDVILELLGRARTRTSEALRDLPSASLDRPSLWGTLEVDVRTRLHQVAAHLVEGTLQCEDLLSALGERSGQLRSLVRRVWSTRGAHEALAE